LGQQVSLEAHVQTAAVLVYISLEFDVAHLVARLKLAVVFGLLLDRIVCQVHHLVGEIGEGELAT